MLKFFNTVLEPKFIEEEVMSIPYRIIKGVCVISPVGDIIAEKSWCLRSLTRKIMSDPNIKVIIFNLAATKRLDSEILGILGYVYHEMLARSGCCLICAADHFLSELLRVTNLNTLIPVYATEEDALAALPDD